MLCRVGVWVVAGLVRPLGCLWRAGVGLYGAVRGVEGVVVWGLGVGVGCGCSWLVMACGGFWWVGCLVVVVRGVLLGCE